MGEDEKIPHAETSSLAEKMGIYWFMPDLRMRILRGSIKPSASDLQKVNYEESEVELEGFLAKGVVLQNKAEN